MKRLLIIGTILTAALVIAIVLKLRAQQAEREAPPGGSGVIEGTAFDLSSRLTARVERVDVEAGQRVARADSLVLLDCEEVMATIAEGEARVVAAIAQLQSAKANTEAARRATGAAWAQAAAARTSGLALAERVEAARRDVKRLELVGEGVTRARLDQTRTHAQSLALEREAAEKTARASSAQAARTQAESNAAKAHIDAAQANVKAARATLDRARPQRLECEITAPRAGVIEEVYVEPAEVAARGSPLVRLVDLDEATITFYLPNDELSAIAVNDQAKVVADAYPDRTFSGTVTTIATEAAFTPRNVQTRSDRDRLVYPVEVALPNPDHALRPGMPAEVRMVKP